MSVSDLSLNEVEQLVSLTASQYASRRAFPSTSGRSASTTRGGSPSRRSVTSLQTVNSTLSVDDASEILSIGSNADDDLDDDDTEWLTIASHCKTSTLTSQEQLKANGNNQHDNGDDRRKAHIERTLRWMNEGFTKLSSADNNQLAGARDDQDGLNIASCNVIRGAQLTSGQHGSVNLNTAGASAANLDTVIEQLPAIVTEFADELNDSQRTLRPGLRTSIDQPDASAAPISAQVRAASASNVASLAAAGGITLANSADVVLPVSDTAAEGVPNNSTKQHFSSLQSLPADAATNYNDDLSCESPNQDDKLLFDEPTLPHWQMQTFRRSSQPNVISGSATITKRSPTHVIGASDSSSGLQRSNSVKKSTTALKPSWSAHAPATNGSQNRQNEALQLARNSVFGAAAELAGAFDPALVMLEGERCGASVPVVTRLHPSAQQNAQSGARNRHSIAVGNNVSALAVSPISTDYQTVEYAHSNSTDDASSIVSSNADSSTHSVETAAFSSRTIRISNNGKAAAGKKPVPSKSSARPAVAPNGATATRLQQPVATNTKRVATAAVPRNVAPAPVKHQSVDDPRVRPSAGAHIGTVVSQSDAIVVPRATAPSAAAQRSGGSRIPPPTSRLVAPKTTARGVSTGQPTNGGGSAGGLTLTLATARAQAQAHAHAESNAFF